MSYSVLTVLVDNETGAILSEDSCGYKKPMFVKFKEGLKYSKTYHMDMVDFENKTFYKYFYACVCNLEMGTNRLVKSSEDLYDGKSMTIKDIAEVCGTTERTIYSFLEYCRDKKIIRRMDIDGEFFGFFVNPVYVFNGDKIQPILYLMFKGYGIEKYINKQGLKLLDKYCSVFDVKEIIKDTYSSRKLTANLIKS